MSVLLWAQEKANPHWVSALENAHGIGFCMYNANEALCSDHLGAKVEALENPETENEYFAFDASWAKKRVAAWAKKQQDSVANFVMLYDIHQTSSGATPKEKATVSSLNSFMILNANASLAFTKEKSVASNFQFQFQHRTPHPILVNTLWREFMTGRSGKLVQEQTITLKGATCFSDFKTFKASFSSWLRNRGGVENND